MLLFAPLIFLGSSSALRAQPDFKGERHAPNPTVNLVTSAGARSARRISINARIEAAINQGNLDRDNNKLDEAERAYKKALSLNPKEVRAYFGLGNVETDHYLTDESAEARQAALQRAINYYRRVVEIDPQVYEAYMALYVSHLQSDSNYEETVQDLRNAAAVAPSNPEPHLELGYFYSLNYQHDEALKELRIAEKLETDPAGLIKIYYRLNEVLGILKGREEEDAENARKWTKLDPKNSYAHQQLGSIYRSQGKYVEAVEELELALKLKPGRFEELVISVLGDTYYDLGLSYLKAKNKAAAMQQYEKLEALGRSDKAKKLLVEINKQ
jgi:tetratricopeptide (TPR) repeat protein